MLEKFIKFGFSAGVLDPKLHGRGDLRNYDLGLAEARNWCIDYLGGAFTRPGTEYCETAQGDVNQNAKLIPFQFNNDVANTYLIVISSAGIYFLQDGSYVPGSAIASPYATADLPLLKWSQDGDVIYLNHPTYAERKLTRLSHASWTLEVTSYSGYTQTTSNVGGSASAGGSAGVVFAVTAVNPSGEEGPLGVDSFEVDFSIVDYTTTAGHFSLAWSRIAGVAQFNIYRSLVIPAGAQANIGMDLGYVGSSLGNTFLDNNIIPDFTRTPLEISNPFAAGGIESIHVTAAGTGYDPNTTTVSVTGGGGTGFAGVPIVSSNAIIGVRILNPGTGYVSPTVSFSGAGTGATATAVATPVTGVHPACGGKVQQRRVRAGTNNQPLGIHGSRIGRPDSYATSKIGLATDPYSLIIDADTQTPIRHIVPSQEGFFAFCDSAVFLVRGTDDSAISALTAKSSPQTAEGASHVQPIKIDKEVLYITTESDSVQAIGPSNLPTYFTTVDRSLLASHYFDSDNPIKAWCYAKAPHRMIWAVREDGSLLSCAYLASQEVFAWSDHSTDGEVEDVVSIRENGYDRVYLLVKRVVGGVFVRFIERLALQNPRTEEDMWAVDCGVRSALTYPNAIAFLSARTGTVSLVASASVFSAGDVGKTFRAGGGRGVVVGFDSASQLTVELHVPVEVSIPEYVSINFKSGDWSLTQNFTSFSGLSHLEGKTVEILADGAEVQTAVVTGGSITLQEPASYVVAGLGFTGRLKTLPPSISGTVLEDREKNVKALAVRLFKARGLRFGDAKGDITYPLPPRNNENYGVAPKFKEGIHSLSIRSDYNQDGSITILKQGPLSATVLGLVMETDIEG